jgi:hypothetical protein
MTKQEFIHCALCGGIVKESESHNAEPLCEGRCCSKCNTERVLPERLKDIFGIDVSEKKESTYIKAKIENEKAYCDMHGSFEDILAMVACCMDAILKQYGEKTLISLTATVLANRKDEANV